MAPVSETERVETPNGRHRRRKSDQSRAIFGALAGIAAFDRRINAAVGQACGQPVNLGQRNAVRNCRAGAYAQAMSQRKLILARAQTENSPLRIAAAR